jgi:NAD(P)-dependent dehydrogenase (short-subunit alcohol dehydrogenase family)
VVCGELEWQTKDHCSKQFQVNFLGVVNAIRTFLPLLKAAKGKHLYRTKYSTEKYHYKSLKS